MKWKSMCILFIYILFISLDSVLFAPQDLVFTTLSFFSLIFVLISFFLTVLIFFISITRILLFKSLCYQRRIASKYLLKWGSNPKKLAQSQKNLVIGSKFSTRGIFGVADYELHVKIYSALEAVHTLLTTPMSSEERKTHKWDENKIYFLNTLEIIILVSQKKYLHYLIQSHIYLTQK